MIASLLRVMGVFCLVVAAIVIFNISYVAWVSVFPGLPEPLSETLGSITLFAISVRGMEGSDD